MKKYVSHIIVVLPWLIAMIFIQRAPETLTMHYDILGRAGNFMPKELVVLMMLGLTLLAHIIILWIIKKYPRQFGMDAVKRKMYYWMMPVSSTFLMWCVIGKYLV